MRSEAEENESHEKLHSAARLKPALARQRSAPNCPELHFAHPMLCANAASRPIRAVISKPDTEGYYPSYDRMLLSTEQYSR